MTFGEICEGKDYLSAAAGHLAASSVELIDPLYPVSYTHLTLPTTPYV